MPIRNQNTLDSGAQGAQVTVANSGASGTAFSRAWSTGVSSYDSAAAVQGARGMLTESAASGTGFECDFAAPVAAAGFSLEFFLPTLNTADFHFARLLDSSAARVVSVHVNSAGKLRFSDLSSTTGVWTATNALVAGTKYRVELWAKAGTTTTNGELRGAYFAAGSTTPIETFTLTNVNTGTGSPFARFFFGRFSTTSSVVVALDSPVWESDGTGLPGPLATPLATPVVTLGTTTNPTTVGGTDGKQVVTWPAVSEAVSYQALRAPGRNAAQSAFVVIASGVTSPYEFTGLAAGDYSFGIRAKAS